MASRRASRDEALRCDITDFLAGQGKYVGHPYSPAMSRDAARIAAGIALCIACEPQHRGAIIGLMRLHDRMRERRLREAMDMIREIEKEA